MKDHSVVLFPLLGLIAGALLGISVGLSGIGQKVERIAVAIERGCDAR